MKAFHVLFPKMTLSITSQLKRWIGGTVWCVCCVIPWLIWSEIKKVRYVVNIGETVRPGVCIFATVEWKVMFTPLFGLSCETEIRFTAALGQNRVSDSSIITLCPQMLHPSLTVLTPRGWIVLPLIPWIAPPVYRLILMKSCLLWDKCWVHPVLRAQRFRKSGCWCHHILMFFKVRFLSAGF